VAVSACLWEDTVKYEKLAFCKCITDNSEYYGQVIIDFSATPNTTVITEFDAQKFKARLFDALK